MILSRLDQQIAGSGRSRAARPRTQGIGSEDSQLQFDLDLCAHWPGTLAWEQSSISNASSSTGRCPSSPRRQISSNSSGNGKQRRRNGGFRSRPGNATASIADDELELAADETRLQGRNLSASEQRDQPTFEERLRNLQTARTRLDQEQFQRDCIAKRPSPLSIARRQA